MIQKFRNDQTQNLTKILLNSKVAVFIDAANLYHSTSKVGIKLDFIQISNWFKDRISNNVDLRFYTAYDPDNPKQIQFINELSASGFVVIKKPIKDFGTFVKGNMDIELAVDAISLKDNFDTLVLISGDGDFTYLINALEKNYKKTVVLSVGGFTSYELHLVADSYFFLDRICKVWQTPRLSNVKTISTDDFLLTYESKDETSPHVNKKNTKSKKIILKID
ncbi:MAG: NYN domain-containing protein [Patescibacteria group bacterium]